MNKAQQAKLDSIIRRIPYFDFYSKDGYEIKQLETEECGRWVSVYIVTGGKGDEGTYAELFCRKYRHFFIGPNGGIRTYVGRGGKDNDKLQYVSEFELLNYRHRH